MNERTKSVLKTVLAAIFFIICVALVVLGQKNVGPQGLLVMLLGLVRKYFPVGRGCSAGKWKMRLPLLGQS